MGCPYLEKMEVGYCTAYPVKKLIPLDSSVGESLCLDEKPSGCPIYLDQISKADEASPERVAKEEAMPTPVGECVWMRQDILSFRLCTLNYECHRCQFEQMIQDSGEHYAESPEIIQDIEKMKKDAGPMRKCKYVLLGKVSTEPCYKNYKCWRCPTFERIKEKIHGIP
jgi:hypothetical protein